jgi:uncharacterized membrane protein YoaK (UPF0700 family)
MTAMAATADPAPTSPTTALRWQEHTAFLVAITAAAAWLDTLAFVHLGKVFLSFMSGNLLFLGIATGQGNGALLGRAVVALAAFVAGSALGARLAGSQLVPGRPGDGMRRTLLVEAGLLAAFALLWAAGTEPDGRTALSLALIVCGAGAMGVQAAVALALHLPNVATVAMTATLAQLGALAGWREREGAGIVAKTPALSLMILLCLAYLVAAVFVATVPEGPLLACGPVVLVLGAALSRAAGSSLPGASRGRHGSAR